jgi:hypothetical protein
MGAESKQGRLHSDQVIGKVTYLTAAASLKPYQQVVRVSTTSSGSAFTVTLPSAVECRGKIFSIRMTARDGSKNVTIQDLANDGSLSDITLDAANEYTILYCDGFNFYEIASNHA